MANANFAAGVVLGVMGIGSILAGPLLGGALLLLAPRFFKNFGVLCYRYDGCLTPDTLVSFNGQMIPIGRVGYFTRRLNNKDIVVIATDGLGYTRLTLDHPVRVLGRGGGFWKRAGEVLPSDRLVLPNDLTYITSIKRETYSGEVFNMNGCGGFQTANAVVAGRCRG